jgi:hypothetical protein
MVTATAIHSRVGINYLIYRFEFAAVTCSHHAIIFVTVHLLRLYNVVQYGRCSTVPTFDSSENAGSAELIANSVIITAN